MFEVKTIGRIHSPLKKIEDCPLQENENAPAARIELLPEFSTAARNIRPGDRVMLLTWLSLADRSVLTTHPRNDANTPLTGVFSTRSPHRPNPIGVHFVYVTDVLPDQTFEVSALEVLDQTPVIDIKPVQ